MTVQGVLRRTDWALLAHQKGLVLDACGAYPELEGLLNWLDYLMDAAEVEGYPVVFLTESEGGTA